MNKTSKIFLTIAGGLCLSSLGIGPLYSVELGAALLISGLFLFLTFLIWAE